MQSCWTKLAKNKFDGVTPEIRQNILSFYKDLNAQLLRRKKGRLAEDGEGARHA